MWKFLSHSFWLTTRDFSSRKLEIFPPSGSPPRLNWISKYFPCPGTAPAQSPGPSSRDPLVPPAPAPLPLLPPHCWDGSWPWRRPSLPAPVTYEATGVVVPDSFGIPEGFQQRVGLQDDVLHVLGMEEGAEPGGYTPAPRCSSPAWGLGTVPGLCVSPTLELGLLRVPPSDGGSEGSGWWG